MTKNLADYLLKVVTERGGYVIDDEHYFEFVGTTKSELDGGILSYVYVYQEPQPEPINGFPAPVGEPTYWICNDHGVREMTEGYTPSED